MPVLHLIAGPNGAGKSTLYRYLIQPRYPQLPFVNADVHEREQLGHIRNAPQRSEAARAWADAERQAYLRAGRSFVSETVFSHPSKLQLLVEAVERGFEVALYVVCLDEPRRLLERVQQRVHEGGHSVPANKILERYPRTLDNLRGAARCRWCRSRCCSTPPTPTWAARILWLRSSGAGSSSTAPGCRFGRAGCWGGTPSRASALRSRPA